MDVDTTTGETSEGKELLKQIERTEQTTNIRIETVTADMGYAHSENYSRLEQRQTEAVIPPQTSSVTSACLPITRFKYDSRNEIVRCPAGRILRRSSRCDKGWFYRASKKDCVSCSLKTRCISSKAKVRLILIKDGYGSLLRARRRWQNRDENIRDKYTRHKWRVEGIHGEAKTQHGLRRAVRRGLANVSIQVYLTAMVMNLKRLAAFIFLFLSCLEDKNGHQNIFVMIKLVLYQILLRCRKNILVLKMAA